MIKIKNNNAKYVSNHTIKANFVTFTKEHDLFIKLQHDFYKQVHEFIKNSTVYNELQAIINNKKECTFNMQATQLQEQVIVEFKQGVAVSYNECKKLLNDSIDKKEYKSYYGASFYNQKFIVKDLQGGVIAEVSNIASNNIFIIVLLEYLGIESTITK